jgi:DNA-binding NtrC family response regulator
MRRHYPDVVFMDLKLPDADGSRLIGELKKDHPSTSFIVITAHGSIRSAVESTRRGAFDYLTKPFEPEQMLHSLEKALKGKVLGEEVKRLRDLGGHLPTRACRSRKGLAYPSEAMRKVRRLASMASEQDGIVLLQGESGTGKDHLARCIHRESGRSDGPFFAINCAALTRELAESELFGHEPGAFTGTRGRKRGLLELAEQGSLLLNEIGELDSAIQSKLLTFLDTRSFIRVGGERSIGIDARIFAATNRDLLREVEDGLFRRDLYYRLAVLPIRLPPLRERRADIPIIVDELIDRLVGDLGLTSRPELTAKAMEVLRAYDWPGNIRELRNVLERAIMLSGGGEVDESCLGLHETPGQWSYTVSFPNGKCLHDITDEVAREVVTEALRRAEGKKQAAARLLGISRHALAHQLKKLGI